MHALKNAFQLQNNSNFIWLAGILFSNLIIQALPKIPKLSYLNRHIVKRGLDWTGKTRTGLRLVKRGLDSISKTRTGLC
jgi:hypothetical protein